MTKEERDVLIQDIEKDIIYFTNLGFEVLAGKFKRDLDIIQSLIPQED